MKALVTGGAGFIGSHITQRLLNEGHSVVVLDDFSSGKEENLKFVEDMEVPSEAYSLIRGTICDYNTCLKACEGVNVILHQAALRSVPKSMDNPYAFNEVNINGILNMLNAAKECGVKRFVFASSSSVYGTTEKFPESEADYPLLISPYALTKLAGEFYCRVFSENYGLETVSLRYFNVFGPRQALDDEYAVVIPKFITCMLNDTPPPVHGTGEQSRDFSYIDNVVEANILAATAQGKFGKVFNVATGNDYSLLKMIELLNKIMKKSINPVFTAPRAGDVPRSLADLTEIEQFLKYKPKVSFEEGLRHTVEWFKQKQGTK